MVQVEGPSGVSKVYGSYGMCHLNDTWKNYEVCLGLVKIGYRGMCEGRIGTKQWANKVLGWSDSEKLGHFHPTCI